MKSKFISTEGDYLEASIEINGKIYIVMDEFGGRKLKPGEEINIELT